MIKILDKTFNLLELLAAAREPRQLSWLSEQSKISLPTCSRIVKDLVLSEYVIQVSRSEGYALGPRAHVLGWMGGYRKELLTVARPLLRDMAEKTRTTMFFCERFGMHRYILCHYCACRQLVIFPHRICYEDLLDSATGLVLTAFAPAKVQKDIIARYGGNRVLVEKLDALPALLKQIAGDQYYVHPQSVRRGQVIMAFSVWKNGEHVGVVGVSEEYNFFEKERDAVIAAGREVAQVLSQAISTQDANI